MENKKELLVKACLGQIYKENTNTIDRVKIRSIFDEIYKDNYFLENINTPLTGGWNALMLCAWSGNMDGVKKLIRLGADSSVLTVGKENEVCVNALHLAITAKQENVAMLLLASNKELLNSKTTNEQTPLMLACEAGMVRMVKKLVDENNVDLDARDKFGNNFEDYCIRAKNNYIDNNASTVEAVINYAMLNKIIRNKNKKRAVNKI